jgi:molybdopterin converting factor small subunit
MEVTVYGPLRSATGEKTIVVDVDPDTVRDVVDAFVDAYPRVRSQLYTDDGTLRPSVRVMVDGERASMADPCPPAAEVVLFPAMRGGAC